MFTYKFLVGTQKKKNFYFYIFKIHFITIQLFQQHIKFLLKETKNLRFQQRYSCSLRVARNTCTRTTQNQAWLMALAGTKAPDLSMHNPDSAGGKKTLKTTLPVVPLCTYGWA